MSMCIQSPADKRMIALGERGLLEYVAASARRDNATIYEVLGRSRLPRVCHARHAIWYALRHRGEGRLSYPDIGALFGRDHSTVISGVQAYERWLAKPRPA